MYSNSSTNLLQCIYKWDESPLYTGQQHVLNKCYIGNSSLELFIVAGKYSCLLQD